MIQRLLLDRIDTKAGAASIRVEHYLPPVVLPDKTKAGVPFFE
jgi:hypothetical protein